MGWEWQVACIAIICFTEKSQTKKATYEAAGITEAHNVDEHLGLAGQSDEVNEHCEAGQN